jgi:hypothetical protein
MSGESFDAKKIQEAQEALENELPENLSEYTGQWVAIRNGEVILAVEKVEDLLTSELLEETDLVYQVPGPGPYLYRAQNAA